MSVSVRLNNGSKVDILVADFDGETVIGLKSLISEALPTKPSPALLKIVFKGRILKDDDLLVTSGACPRLLTGSTPRAHFSAPPAPSPAPPTPLPAQASRTGAQCTWS